MSVIDWAIVVVAALVGWGIVSGIVTVVRQQRSPPYQPEPPPATAGPPASGLSVAEMGERWNEILGTSQDASPAEIEAAFQAGIAACDRIRDSAEATTAEHSAAETRRVQIGAAYEFIRPLRQS